MENKENDSEKLKAGSYLIVALLIILLTFCFALLLTSLSEKNGLITETAPDGSEASYYYIRDEKQTGWQVVDYYKRYFDSTGKMVTGLYEIDGKTYYFNLDNGSVTINSNITLDDGTKCYFDEYGIRTDGHRIGWYTEADGSKSYYNQSGSKTYGWREIDGRNYYFQITTGRMLVSENACIDGVLYSFDEHGQAVQVKN